MSLTGVFVMIAYDLFAALLEHFLHPGRHDMLGFGIYLHFTGWALVILLPLCIGLGELWWNDYKRYIPHCLLLIALVWWSMDSLTYHPNRTLLFLACASASLPMRLLIDKRTARNSELTL